MGLIPAPWLVLSLSVTSAGSPSRGHPPAAPSGWCGGVRAIDASDTQMKTGFTA
jgi:hypothetical protein